MSHSTKVIVCIIELSIVGGIVWSVILRNYVERYVLYSFVGLYLLLYVIFFFLGHTHTIATLFQLLTPVVSLFLLLYAHITYKYSNVPIIIVFSVLLLLSRFLAAFGHVGDLAIFSSIESVFSSNMGAVSAKVLYIIIATSIIFYYRSSNMDRWILSIEIMVNVIYGAIYISLSYFESQYALVAWIQAIFSVVLDVNALFLTLYICKKFNDVINVFDRTLLISSRVIYLLSNFLTLFVPYTYHIEPIISLGLVVAYISYLRYVKDLKESDPLAVAGYRSVHKNMLILTWVFPTIYLGLWLDFDSITSWLLVIGGILLITRQALIGIDDHNVIKRFTQLNRNFDGAIEQRMQELLASEQKYQSLFTQMEESLILLNRKMEVIKYNPAYELFLAEHCRDVDQRDAFDWIIQQDRGAWTACVTQVLQNEKVEFQVEIVDDAARKVYIEVKVFPYLLQDEIVGIIILMKDQTQFIESQNYIEELAYIDQLTQVWNRHTFIQMVEPKLGSAYKQAALLFIDLNNFKEMNDRRGHDFGDAVLREFALRSRELVQQEGIICRFSGDEFLIMIPDQNQEDIECFVKRFIERLQAPFGYKSTLISIHCSIGISLYPQDGATLDELIMNADMAMYRVKKAIGEYYHFYDESLREGMNRKSFIQGELLRCIDNNQLMLYYQPQYDMQEEAFIGVEALLRWKHPQLGFIPPLEFIPLAEENGMIHAIGNWIIEEACRQLQAWSEQGIRAPIAINVSLQQLEQHDFTQHVVERLAAYQIDHSLLKIEVTESIAMSRTEYAARGLHELYGQGFSISLDDFGTGYSSLSYLMTYPIDTLKIDRAFIWDISSTNKVKLVDTIVHMAHQLDIDVIAEGVETIEQMDYLRNINCRYIQGYYISKPLPAVEVTELLRNQNKTLHLDMP